jgi:hypothetical protein
MLFTKLIALWSAAPYPPEGQGELADVERENTSILPSPSGGKGGGLGAEKQNRAEIMSQRASSGGKMGWRLLSVRALPSEKVQMYATLVHGL